MSGEAPRLAAWDALDFWLNGQGWVLEGLQRYTENLVDPRDRALAYNIALGTCRRHTRLGDIVKKFSSRPPKRRLALLLEMSLYQLFFMDRVPDHAVVDAAVRLVRADRQGESAAKFVNAVLRRALREGLPPLPENPRQRLGVEYSLPSWLLGRWLRTQSLRDIEERMRSTLDAPWQWIRVHTARIAVDDLLARLGVEALAQTADGFVALPAAGTALRHESFAQGLFSFQNPAAGLVAQMLDVHAGMRVWDACAAPGGKTALLAERIPDAYYVASDNDPVRAQSLHDLPTRLQIRSLSLAVTDAARPPFAEVFDRILLDVPCSNLGVLGRRPEVLQRLRQEELESLPKLQLQLLEGASQALRPGGILVYATCSPEPEETYAVIDAFLRTHPEYSLAPLPAGIDAQHCRKGCLLVSGADGYDRFFAARLRKEPA